ncbi:MAG TPA: hypothetical protein ENN33_09975 [Ignavibacteria bacterium]|nr:hypothetical protein [Ignavibacteria bacterium]
MKYLFKMPYMMVLLLLVLYTGESVGQLKKVSPEHKKLVKEYSDLYKKIDAIQKEAMSDPELIEAGEKLRNKMTDLMIKKDPSVKKLLEDRENIETQVEANPTMDQESLKKLHAEYQELTKKLVEHQHSVMEQPDIKAEAERIDEKVRQRMNQINPETPKLIERMKVLQEKLEAVKQ